MEDRPLLNVEFRSLENWTKRDLLFSLRNSFATYSVKYVHGTTDKPFLNIVMRLRWMLNVSQQWNHLSPLNWRQQKSYEIRNCQLKLTALRPFQRYVKQITLCTYCKHAELFWLLWKPTQAVSLEPAPANNNSLSHCTLWLYFTELCVQGTAIQCT